MVCREWSFYTIIEMDLLDKNYTLKKKPPLPEGWAVYPSRSYPNRVYYYNHITGCSSWCEPLMTKHSGENEEEETCNDSTENKRSKSRSNSSSSSETDLDKTQEHKSILNKQLKIERTEYDYCKIGTISGDKRNENIRPTSGNKVTPPSSSDDTSLESEEANVLRKRRWKSRTSSLVDLTSDSDVEKKSSKKVKLNRTGTYYSECVQNLCDSSSDMIRRKRSVGSNIQSQSPLTKDKYDSSSLPSSRTERVKIHDSRNILIATRSSERSSQNDLKLPERARQQNSEKQTQDSSSACVGGLAAKRLKALQDSLAKKQASKSEDCENDPPKKIIRIQDSSSSGPKQVVKLVTSSPVTKVEPSKQGNSNSAASNQNKLLTAIRSQCHTSKTDFHRDDSSSISSSIAKVGPSSRLSDNSTVTSEWQFIRTGVTPGPDSSKTGYSKGLAAKRLEDLQKKLSQERKIASKKTDPHQSSLPINKANVNKIPVAVPSREKSPACDKEIIITQSRNSSGFFNIVESPGKDDPGISRTLNTNSQLSTASNLRFSDSEVRSSNKSDASENSFDEVMDWETSEEEKILSHIQEVRNQIQDGEINTDDKCFKASSNYDSSTVFSATEKQEWFIVLDTNILISCLSYVEQLRDTSFKGLGFPVLIIPWQVLQELDVMKDQRGNTKSSKVTLQARKAVSFLLSNFMSKHPRIRGQTALDALPQGFKNEVPDDSILQCCLQLAQVANEVILLSNDKNLCNKAIVNGVEAYPRAEIEKVLEKMSSETMYQKNIQDIPGNDPYLSRIGTPKLERSQVAVTETSKADLILCKLKSLLKDILGKVLENEMRETFGSLWHKIILIKPPWVLSDILSCIQKHWIAVFSTVFPRAVKPAFDTLDKFFGEKQNKGYGHSLSEIKNILQKSMDVCMGISHVSYGEVVFRTISDLEKLQQLCEETKSPASEERREDSLNSPYSCQTQNVDVNPVVEKLENVYQYVQHFCGIMCDTLRIQHPLVYNRPNPFPSLEAVQDKLPHIYPNIRTLIKSIVSIQQIPPEELTADHDAIKKFYFTLTQFATSVENEIEDRITPELILRFCIEQTTRNSLQRVKSKFLDLETLLDRGIHFFVQAPIT